MDSTNALKVANRTTFREIFFVKGFKVIDLNDDGKVRSLSAMLSITRIMLCEQEYELQMKHAQFLKLFPSMTIANFDELKTDADAFHKFEEQFQRTRCKCRIYVWCESSEEETRYSLTLYPDD